MKTDDQVVIEILILGPTLVRRPGRDIERVGGRPGSLLAYLVLQPQRAAHADILVAALWLEGDGGRDLLQQVVRRARVSLRLKEEEDPIPIQEREVYRLAPSLPVRTDLQDFRDGLDELPADPGPQDLLPLLRLWRGDPRTAHAEMSPDHWSSPLASLGNLITLIERLGPEAKVEVRDEARRLALQLGTDTLAERLEAAVVPPPPAPPRQRLLVVDDQVADAYAKVLRPSYDCVILTSEADWFAFAAGGDRRFDGALVDLHLDPVIADFLGSVICKQLRQLIPGIQIMLMSAAAASGKDGMWGDLDSLREEYGVDMVYNKDKEGADRRHLLGAVERLLRPRS